MRFGAVLRAAGRDRRGTTAVEFGLIATPTILTFGAILAIGLNFYMVAALDHATLAAARAVATGAVSTAGMTADTFAQTLVCPALPAVFSCSNVFVNLTTVTAGQSPTAYYGYVNGARSGLIQPPLNSATDSFCPGAGSQYVVLQVLYPAPILMNFLTPASPTVYNGQTVNVLMSSTTFKSEPYAGAVTYSGC